MSRVHSGFREREGDDWYDGYQVQDASLEMAYRILCADEDSEDGRSQFVYIRLPDGDLVLAVYPQGDTYLATEDDRTI